MASTLLQRATTVHTDETGLASHRVVDVRIVDGVIVEVGPSSSGAPSGTPGAGSGPTPDHVVDLDGYVLLPAAVEPHAHLDKAFLSERITNETGDLMGAITAMQANRHLLAVDETIERAERAARLMAANGYHAVRTHADTTVAHGLRSIEALSAVKQRVADVIDVEIVALCGWPMTGSAGADQRALLRDAMQSGADIVGGVPHLEGDNDREATEILLQVATDAGVAVDLHTDETLDPTALGLVDLAEMKLAGFAHAATASHCVSLGVQTASEQQRIAELVAEADIPVIALPHTNLYLQGRGHAPMPRGLTAVAALRSAGATVAAGADNLQDPFNPVGRACPFETAGLMVMAAHLLPHEAWVAVSAASSTATNCEVVEIAPGSPAHLVAARADTLREAIAFGPSDRIVWRHGRRL
ncbi:MAG: amidohydrolase family protein [Ilumatobacter sp.]|uniref:amidohydrolase family protein n=1 Tax=Ilumatobacter sp. TaxID=1967498 RepID=UPI003C75819A